MAVLFTLSDEQYEALVDALTVAHPNKNVNKHKSHLIGKLPKTLSENVNKLRSVVDDVSSISTKNSRELIRQLIVLDTAELANGNTGNNISKALINIFKKDKVLAQNVRDSIFDKSPDFVFLGQLVRHILAEALVDAGCANDEMFKYYKSMTLGKYPGSQTVRIFEKMIKAHTKYSKDIPLLTQIGSQSNRRVAMIAVSVADKKILPYLVSITNKQAREAVKKMMNA